MWAPGLVGWEANCSLMALLAPDCSLAPWTGLEEVGGGGKLELVALFIGHKDKTISKFDENKQI